MASDASERFQTLAVPGTGCLYTSGAVYATQNAVTVSNEVEAAPEENHVARFMNRVKYLLMTDPDLSVAEAIGCLHMLAHELASHGVFPEWHDDGED